MRRSNHGEKKESKKMSIHENLKKARLAAGISQKDFAERLRVYQKDVSRWESGEHVPSIGMLVKICRELNVSADEILELNKKSDILDGNTIIDGIKVVYDEGMELVRMKRGFCLNDVRMLDATWYMLAQNVAAFRVHVKRANSNIDEIFWVNGDSAKTVLEYLEYINPFNPKGEIISKKKEISDLSEFMDYDNDKREYFIEQVIKGKSERKYFTAEMVFILRKEINRFKRKWYKEV